LRWPTPKQRFDPRQEGGVTQSINERIKDFHHFTMPVKSLERAERFYTGVFGAEITRRLHNHISVVLGTGPRIDLFQQDKIVPGETRHPHFAWDISPADLLRIMAVLDERGVGYDGPSRNGPPGCAQFYVDDPDGNHLEFQCDGFEGETPPAGFNRGKMSPEWSSI
jgi:catechol 2,3-dioxygenase-like lactoylglutathione lyase family enzyme